MSLAGRSVAIRASLAARPVAVSRRVPAAARPCLPLPRALPGTASLPDLPGEKGDLPGFLAVAGLAVTELSKQKFAMTPELLYASLAVYSLVYSVLCVVNGAFATDRIGQVVAPTFLAAAALGFFNGHLTAFQTATAAFGYFLAQGLPGPLPLWLASLGYAIYSNHAAEWAVAAFGLTAAWKIFSAAKDKKVPAPAQVLFAALAGWAFYSNTVQQVALLVYGGHVLASTVS